MAPDEIHIHVLRLEPPSPHIRMEEFLPLLSFEEQGRYKRFSLESRKREFLCSRLLLRWALASGSGKGIESLEFEYGSHGKPYLKDGFLEFNLSHTENLAVVALSPRRLGVDIESLESPGWNNRPWRLLAGRYFSNPEKEYLFSLPEAEQPAAFLRIFTLKEAGAKAIGEGLAAGLAGGWIPLPIQEEFNWGTRDYFSKILRPQNACLALAVENPDRSSLAYKVWEWRLEDFKKMLQNPTPAPQRDLALPV